VSESPVPKSSTPSLGVIATMSIGIGGMVGGGIFAVLGEAIVLAHGATPLAFAIAGGITLLTAYSYSRLSTRYPSQGGTIVFIDEAFGHDLLTGGINLLLWLSYLVTLSLYAVAFGSYAATFFPAVSAPWLKHVLISTGILLPVVINLFSADIVSKSEALVVVIKLSLLAVIIVAGSGFVDPGRFAPATWGSPATVISAGMIIFVAYEGFELIANSALDVKNPEKTLPRAYYGSVILVIILYVLIAMITVGSVPEDRIIATKDYALAEAARPALGQFGFVLVAISALLATFSAINATIYGGARLSYSLAKDRELPEILDHKAWNEPVFGVVAVGFLSLLSANLLDMTSIAIIASAGFLVIFLFANAAAVKLSKETGGRMWISLIAAIGCLAALCILLWHTWSTSPVALAVFAAFIASAFLFEFFYGRSRNKPYCIVHPGTSKGGH